MGLFSKKRTPSFNRTRFIEAIIIDGKINLQQIKRNEHAFPYTRSFSRGTGKIGDHFSFSFFIQYHSGGFTTPHWICFLSTYVDNIQMAEYSFELKDNSAIYKAPPAIWTLSKLNIIHKMPDQFIELMNQWSGSVISEKQQEITNLQRQEELLAQTKFEQEEQRLEEERAYLMQFR